MIPVFAAALGLYYLLPAPWHLVSPLAILLVFL